MRKIVALENCIYSLDEVQQNAKEAALKGLKAKELQIAARKAKNAAQKAKKANKKALELSKSATV